jgi:phosphoenolpyruvate carboxykinase (GTP)
MKTNPAITTWVEQVRELCKPDAVQWVTGSEAEVSALYKLLVEKGTLIKLNEDLRPGSYLARSDPRDVDVPAYLCTKKKEDAGFTNQWADATDMKKKMSGFLGGCMRGRTMYVVPFALGPANSRHAKLGIQITDSPYVVVNLRLLTKVGAAVEELFTAVKENFFTCLHSVGHPLAPGETDVAWPCNPPKTNVVFFPEDNSIMSYGSASGGNAFLNVRAALRLFSITARKSGTKLAEHCSLIKVTSPANKDYYICAILPDGSLDRIQLSMLIPTIPGWTVRCVGDHVAWFHIGEDGRLYALSPLTGFHNTLSGNTYNNSRGLIDTLKSNTIFINTALTAEGDIWWEGLTKEVPQGLKDWNGNDWNPDSSHPASHPQARYTVAAHQSPVVDTKDWENPEGVPISAFLLGNRRSKLVPLVYEALSWEQGVFTGSTLSVERLDDPTDIHYDPFAITSYCGYSISDYLAYWAAFRKNLGWSSPRIFFFNPFRKDDDTKEALWPGGGENSRVFKWICERIDGQDKARRTPIGYIPTFRGFSTAGLGISATSVHALLHSESSAWLEELKGIKEFYKSFDKIPASLQSQLSQLEKRLQLEENQPPTHNAKLLAFVEEVRKLCLPDKVHWCTGTEHEYDELCNQLVKSGTFIRLNEKLRPNSFLARSDPKDVARVESCTYICSDKKEDAGPTNNWADPNEMKFDKERRNVPN